MNDVTLKPKIEDIERALLTTDMEQPNCITRHIFSPGVYVREITMPAGAIILGAEHNTKHLNILSKGVCILADVDTEELTDLIAPCTFESEAGVRKLLYVVEECVWSTVHVTEETEVEVLESTLFNMSPTYKEIVGDKFIPGGRVNECMGGRRNGSSRDGISNKWTEGSSSRGR